MTRFFLAILICFLTSVSSPPREQRVSSPHQLRGQQSNVIDSIFPCNPHLFSNECVLSSPRPPQTGTRGRRCRAVAGPTRRDERQPLRLRNRREKEGGNSTMPAFSRSLRLLAPVSATPCVLQHYTKRCAACPLGARLLPQLEPPRLPALQDARAALRNLKPPAPHTRDLALAPGGDDRGVELTLGRDLLLPSLALDLGNIRGSLKRSTVAAAGVH